MKVGYKDWEVDELVNSDSDNITDAAEQFADWNHQVDEESDINFEIVVVDNEGSTHIVNMTTEYDPRYIITKITESK
jgi:hypothetical protein